MIAELLIQIHRQTKGEFFSITELLKAANAQPVLKRKGTKSPLRKAIEATGCASRLKFAHMLKRLWKENAIESFRVLRDYDRHSKTYKWAVTYAAVNLPARPPRVRAPVVAKPKPAERTTLAVDFDPVERSIALESKREEWRKQTENVPAPAPTPAPSPAPFNRDDYEQIVGGPYADEMAQARAVVYIRKAVLGFAGIGEVASAGAVPLTVSGALFARSTGVRPEQAHRVASAIRSLNRDYSIRVGLHGQPMSPEALRQASVNRGSSGPRLQNPVKTRMDWPIF